MIGESSTPGDICLLISSMLLPLKSPLKNAFCVVGDVAVESVAIGETGAGRAVGEPGTCLRRTRTLVPRVGLGLWSGAKMATCLEGVVIWVAGAGLPSNGESRAASAVFERLVAVGSPFGVWKGSDEALWPAFMCFGEESLAKREGVSRCSSSGGVVRSSCAASFCSAGSSESE